MQFCVNRTEPARLLLSKLTAANEARNHVADKGSFLWRQPSTAVTAPNRNGAPGWLVRMIGAIIAAVVVTLGRCRNRMEVQTSALYRPDQSRAKLRRHSPS